ncbi:hypothetical protein [Sphingobium boeckii]|uniref:Uncharacterized protein n=1 Tax=Sphingobium boeckii TaxID=1082345 RepID=A0A7W9AG35_9SPHN|nr:hypothetical protein [Sphingobium boeckii]MBB5684819.1 hypothetical protein [Sphingobium boeckii]
MKIKTPDGAEAMQLDSIERAGNTFILKTRVLGAMPMNVVLTPEAMREGIKMLGWRMLPFALSFLFRQSGK